MLFRLHERLVRSDAAKTRTPSSKGRAGKASKHAARERDGNGAEGAGGSARSVLTAPLLVEAEADDEEAGGAASAGGGRDGDY